MENGMQELKDELDKLRARGVKGISFFCWDKSIGTEARARDLLAFLKAVNDPNTKWLSMKDLPEGM